MVPRTGAWSATGHRASKEPNALVIRALITEAEAVREAIDQEGFQEEVEAFGVGVVDADEPWGGFKAKTTRWRDWPQHTGEAMQRFPDVCGLRFKLSSARKESTLSEVRWFWVAIRMLYCH